MSANARKTKGRRKLESESSHSTNSESGPCKNKLLGCFNGSRSSPKPKRKDINNKGKDAKDSESLSSMGSKGSVALLGPPRRKYDDTPLPELSHEKMMKMGEGKYAKIRKECFDSKSLYEDPEFPASSKVLFRGGHVYGVRWKRPGEISRSPKYIKDGLTHPDIHQGTVGNCWFIASVATIAASSHKDLLNRVIPRDQGFKPDEYCGAFRFYFWSYGKWTEVIVDDRLPTLYNKLLYASNKSDPDEYWCPLIEKAYAKFCGSYHALHADRLGRAMVDLTGGISEIVPLKSEISDSQLKQLLVNCQAMNSLIGGAIFMTDPYSEREQRMDNGLYEGHAYSVTEVKEVKYGGTSSTVVLVRNPWGKGEWNGAWSDGSKEWTTLSRDDQLASHRKRDDGEFWMDVSDFRRNFDELEVCHLTPDAMSKEIADNLHRSQWHMTEHRGAWVRGLSAGGPPYNYTSRKFWSNPQFRLRLERAPGPTTVVISLCREKRPGDTDDVSIGIVIFKLNKGRKPSKIRASNFYEFTPQLVETSGPFWPYRERTVHFVMDPADHVIVPCTYEPDQEATFYMRVFAEGDLITETIDEDEDEDEAPTISPVVPKPEPKPTDPDDSKPDNKPEPEPKPTDPKPSVPEDSEETSEEAIEAAFSAASNGSGNIDATDLVSVIKAGLQAGDEKDHPGFNVETCRCLVGLSVPNADRGLLDRKEVAKIWSELQVWRKAFRIVDKDKSRLVDMKELKRLFQVVDIHAEAETVATVMKRYGGKDNQMAEEDFLQSFCKIMQACRIYRELTAAKKVFMTLNEWLAATLQI